MTEQSPIKFKIDDRELTVAHGTSVIDAARREGIGIPAFCYYPSLPPQAACRMCLVEVEKAPKLQTACTLAAVNGMVVRTDTEQVHAARKQMLEFLLTNHPLDCPVCDKGGECELQDMTFRYGAEHSRFVEEKLHTPEVKWSNLVYYDAPRCILCFRCVNVCDQGMDVKALGVGSRGAHSVIIPNEQDHLDCVECGMCIDVCPVGALTSGTYRYHTRPWEMNYVSTVCTHCSNGCKTTLSVRNHQILRANNRDQSGFNNDFLCAKGRFGFDFTYHPNRLHQPLVRRDGKLQPASWEDALEAAASRLAAVRAKNGADAIGVYGSNRTTNEENYLLGRIARAALGTNHLDHHRTADYAGVMEMAARLEKKLDKSAASQTGGLSAWFASMNDLGSAPAFLLIGNDAGEQNPLVAWQIRAAIRHFGSRLYVVNPQQPKWLRTVAFCMQSLAGQEAAVLAELAASGDSGSACAELRQSLETENDLVVLFGAALQGSGLASLAAFAEARAASGKRTRFVPLGDYVNSRGAAEMGLLPDRLPGYAWLDDPAARDACGQLWGAAPPESAGLTAPAMLDAALSGRLRALYVVGANPAKRLDASAERLGQLDLLIVQDLFLSETARRADIVLPALSAYEKDGTMTTTTGEIQMVRKAGDFMGARSDFDILRFLSHQLARHGVGQPIRLATPEAAFAEIRRHVPGYDIAWEALLAGSAQQSAPRVALNGHAARAPGAREIFSNQDGLFTSGSLTDYCRMIQSLREAGSQP